MSHYDEQNIFAKILKGDLPCDKLFENDHVLAFNDIAPQAPTHVLVIPKSPYIDAADFYARASTEEISAYYQAIHQVIQTLKLTEFRLITNAGASAGQTVFHFHTHILGGKELGALVGNGG